MIERVMSVDALQAYFAETFRAKQVRVREKDGGLLIEPVKAEKRSSADSLRGMFSDCPEISADKFLERKHADKGLDL